MAKQIVIVSVVYLIIAISGRNVSATIGGDPESLVRITTEVCRPEGHDEEFARNFYKCYSTALTEKEKCLFEKCQNRVFGNLLDTKVHIAAACTRATELPNYQSCLTAEFQACQQDVFKALTNINVCQAPLLGLE